MPDPDPPGTPTTLRGIAAGGRRGELRRADRDDGQVYLLLGGDRTLITRPAAGSRSTG